MILLAFFFPLAIYFLVLGLVNRRRCPLLISGVWDGIGLIFGVCGFLLFAGPAVLSALNERWRLFWLLGKGDILLAGPNGAEQFWIFLSFLYFLAIVGGAAYYFWRQRRLTAIYNAEAEQIERALLDVCQQWGINPMRSGDLFVLASAPEPPSEQDGAKLLSQKAVAARFQRAGEEKKPGDRYVTNVPPQPSGTEAKSESLFRGEEGFIVAEECGLEQTAILEVDSFPLMRHVTLRWEPADSPLRRMLESELGRRLSEMPSDNSPLSGWLLTVGSVLLSFDLAGAFFLVLLHVFTR